MSYGPYHGGVSLTSDNNHILKHNSLRLNYPDLMKLLLKIENEIYLCFKVEYICASCLMILPKRLQVRDFMAAVGWLMKFTSSEKSSEKKKKENIRVSQFYFLLIM